MANPTTNYGFILPTSSDLVTDLPADFEVALQGVDTQMKTNADAATQKATLTTKGDIYAATGTSTPARLAVGTNNQVLTADSSTATGLKWATPAGGGGKILQVVTNTYSTVFTTTSTTPVDTGLSTTITPTSATSRILVMYNGIHQMGGGGADSTNLRLVRTSTNILTYNANGFTNTSNLFAHTIACHVVDSPATTSAITYKVQIFCDLGRTLTAQRNSEGSILTLLEIGA
jgi:hypothetical protein